MYIKERYDRIMAPESMKHGALAIAAAMKALREDCANQGHYPDGIEWRPGFQKCSECDAVLRL